MAYNYQSEPSREQLAHNGGVAVAEVPQVFERALAELPLRKIGIEAEFIGAGPITGNITAVRIKHNGKVVTEVPQGEHFDVEVDYSANNPGALQWAVAATMITTAGELPNYDVTMTVWPSDTLSGTMKLDAMGFPGPMPDHDITLRIRLFGNQERTTTPPPQTQW
ncbi:hypothetical protein ES703_43792 [subsurface metagenome]